MTQYPECYFARELGICYAAIAAITDYDVGLHEDLTIDPSSMDEVLKVFKGNIQKTKDVLLAFIEQVEPVLSCECASVTLKAYYEDCL